MKIRRQITISAWAAIACCAVSNVIVNEAWSQSEQITPAEPTANHTPSDIQSGLTPGTDVVAWEPKHLTGPDQGTKTCPVCTYLAQPVVLVFAKDNKNTNELAKNLEQLAKYWKDEHLKVFLIISDGNEKGINQLAGQLDLQDLSVCLLREETREKDLANYQINPEADNSIMIYHDFVVQSNFVNLPASEFGRVRTAVAETLPDVFPITPANARVSFIGTAGRNRKSGKFKKISGHLRIPGSAPLKASVEINVDTTSLDTKFRLLTNHLKKADFLDVEDFTTAKFVSTSIEKADKENFYSMTGNLTIHGVTREIEFPIGLVIKPDKILTQLSFDVLQSQFGMAEATKSTDDKVKIKFAARIQRLNKTASQSKSPAGTADIESAKE